MQIEADSYDMVKLSEILRRAKWVRKDWSALEYGAGVRFPYADLHDFMAYYSGPRRKSE